ncbi:MAG: OsmC family peroxiredoxin [Spirochaetia bacterium]|nr:OsmC family peroxiredoxin [Spirochaetia bacterium]MDZ7795493.1 OsmC family peroxiredoxin [Spirochaetia bacterium]
MLIRNAKAAWKDTVSKGKGAVELGSGAFKGSYSYGSRFEEEQGTNPEELIGAAHAGCFSMALSLELENAGYTPVSIATQAKVHLNAKELEISQIDLITEAQVEGIEESEFQKIAEGAKSGCPVSKALGGVNNINLTARLQK